MATQWYFIISTTNKTMPSSSRVQLQRPRPPSVDIARNSHQINKKQDTRREPPVIVHVRSPRIIHAKPQDFMSLVQRLTGNNSSSGSRGEVIGDGGNRDPLLLTLGQNSTTMPVSPSFFVFSPRTSSCLQDSNLLVQENM